MPNVFIGHVAGDFLPAADWNSNWSLAETSFQAVGSGIVSGLTISIGTGLSVNVTSGTALIGALVTAAASFSIGGLTDNTINFIYLLSNGTGTSNTTGTSPANSAFLGTAVTAAGAVTGVTPAVVGLLYVSRSGFGHVIMSGGPAPTAVAGANNGTTPPAPVVVAGANDARGTVTFGTGTAAAAGDQVDVTFARAFAAVPIILMTPLDNVLVDVQPTIGNRATTGFSLFTKLAPTSSEPNTFYKFSYACFQ